MSRIGISESHLSRFENGKRVPSPEDVSALLVIYGVTGEIRQELLALAKKAGQPGLWRRYKSTESRFVTLKLLESRAAGLVSFEPLVIPGLLQTMPYAEACIRRLLMMKDQDAVEERVIGRVHRQAVLRKADAPPLVAIIGEAALRCPIGGRKVLRDQLRYLVEAAERSNITLRIVPTLVAGHPGLLGGFLRLTFADRPNVVLLENQVSGLYLEDHSDVSAYDQTIVQLLDVAMPEEDSVRFVAEMAMNMEFA